MRRSLSLMSRKRRVTADLRVLTFPGAHCRWKAGLRTEVALDGLELVTPKADIFDVAERFAVLGLTDVKHKRFVTASKHPLQVEPLDKINLSLPALRFEGALADMVVAGCAGKCEVVRQQDVDRVPVFLLPCRVPFADSLIVLRAQSGLRFRARRLRDDRRCGQCACTRLENRPARHCSTCHDSFPPCI